MFIPPTDGLRIMQRQHGVRDVNWAAYDPTEDLPKVLVVTATALRRGATAVHRLFTRNPSIPCVSAPSAGEATR